MSNTELLNEFDMVLAMSESTINAQLKKLVTNKELASSMIITQDLVGTNYVFKILESADQIPRDAQGNPTVAYISADILPQVRIAETGTKITFLIDFQEGDAAFYIGGGRSGGFKTFEMKSWQYGVAVNLELQALSKDKMDHLPQKVRDQLNKFSEEMFTIQHLLLDLNSTALSTPDALTTITPGANKPEHDAFVEFVQAFLEEQIKNGNPYILGYNVESKETNRFAANQVIPGPIRPVGTTYTMFHDPTDQSRSTLNFAMVTAGGKVTVPGSAPFLSMNLLDPQSPAQSRMVYSNRVLIEKLILEPFFWRYRASIYDQINSKLDVSPGLGLPQAMGHAPHLHLFNIADDKSGSDEYTNSFVVSSNSIGGQINLNFSGYMHFYKKKSKKLPFCRAHASAKTNISWSGTISLVPAKDAQGRPTLRLDQVFHSNAPDNHTHKDGCAKGWDEISKILGGLIDTFSFGSNIVGQLFSNMLSVPTGEGNGPSVGAALNALGTSLPAVFLLPAGDVFEMGAIAIDSDSNVYLDLSQR